MRLRSSIRTVLLLLGVAASPLGCGGSAPESDRSTSPEPKAEVEAEAEAIVEAPETVTPAVIKPLAAPPLTPLTGVADRPSAGAVDAEPAGEAAPADRPASVDGIVGLLLARHAEDLPEKATLDAHAEAPETLRWIALHDERLIIQARALEALGLWPDDTNRAFLLRVASDSTAQVKSRAAAWKGLAAWDLKADVELHAAATEATADPAVPIARAAQAALGL